MDNLNKIIGDNLKQIRNSKKLSLDNVSKLCGVSKSMLAQIEKGDVNPTVSTIWKISNGLKISFSELINRKDKDIEIIKKENLNLILEDNGKYRNFPIFVYNRTIGFETYLIEIDKAGTLSSSPHEGNIEEYITIFSGELTLTVDSEMYVLNEGDSIRFNANAPHKYFNSGDKITRIHMILHYK